MDIPFKITFRHFHNTWEEVKELKTFVTEEAALYLINTDEVLSLKENLSLSITFQSEDPEARFYMDGLDTLPQYSVKEDESGQIYLSPSLNEQTIFQSFGDEYYPLIPGFYRLYVKAFGNSYFSWVKVLPKQITQNEWELLRDEVEETVHGLAQDLVRKGMSIDSSTTGVLPVFFLRKLMLLKQNYSRLTYAMSDLSKKPKYSVKNNYEIVSRSRVKLIDEKSIKFMSIYPERKHEIYTPNRIENYDLPENRYIVKLIGNLLTECNMYMESIDYYELHILNQIDEKKKYHNENHHSIKSLRTVLLEIRDYKKLLRNARSQCRKFLNSIWIEKVNQKTQNYNVISNILDQRYRIIHRFYRAFCSNTFEIKLDQTFSYHWKRTDYLYEIWGYITIIKNFMDDENGFKPVSGWIFDKELEGNYFNIPVLEPGTMVKMEKDDITIKLIYDKELPRESKYTSPSDPLYTSGSHNRPDVRIDIFYNDSYASSILVDFKYRRRQVIWENSKIRTNQQTKVMRQLDSYYSNGRSKWLFYNALPEVYRNIITERFKPVQNVWVIYPTNNTQKPIESFDDYGITLIELRPDKNKNELTKLIKKSVEKAIGVLKSLSETSV